MAAFGEFNLQQVADAGDGPLVDQGGELPVLRIVPGHHRRLQQRDHIRVVHVVLAAVHVLEQPSLADAFRPVPGTLRQVLGIGFQVVEVRALDAALRAFEAQGNHVLAQTHDLEQLRAAVARDGRDPHLGHDLEQTLANAAPVASADLLPLDGVHLQRTLAQEVEQGLIREVRIHRGRAVADEAGEMMRIARRARLDQQIALAAQARLDQAVMHGPGGEQGVNGDLALDEVSIRQQQDELAGAHRRFRLIADREDCGLELEPGVELQIDELMRHARIVETHDLAELALREHGRTQHDLFGVLLGRYEDVAFGTDLRLQRHDDALAQRVDRRIGDLGELLAEIIVEGAHLLRQHRHRRVIAHRAHRLALVFGEHADDLIALLGRDVVHLLEQRQRVPIEGLGREARIDQIGLQVAHALLEPHLVGVPAL